MDIYKEIGDIKQGQERILSVLSDLIDGKSREKIYDAVDLMEVLKISRRTLATYKEKGILTYAQVNGKMWVTEAQLRSFLDKYSNDRRFINNLRTKKGGVRNE